MSIQSEPSISEEELIGMLAVLKRQQAALEQQHKVVLEASSKLEESRRLFAGELVQALAEVRAVPEQAIGTLTDAVETAAGKAVRKSLSASQKTLEETVNAAVERINEIRGETLMPALIGALIGSIVGGCAVAGLFAYALNSGMITPPAINLNPQVVAEYLKPALQQRR